MPSVPASTAGWLATMPAGRPSSRADPTTMFSAKGPTAGPWTLGPLDPT